MQVKHVVFLYFSCYLAVHEHTIYEYSTDSSSADKSSVVGSIADWPVYSYYENMDPNTVGTYTHTESVNSHA